MCTAPTTIRRSGGLKTADEVALQGLGQAAAAVMPHGRRDRAQDLRTGLKLAGEGGALRHDGLAAAIQLGHQGDRPLGRADLLQGVEDFTLHAKVST